MNNVVVETEKDRERLIRLIQGRALPFTVRVLKGVKRSLPQNRLQRLWCNEAALQGDHTAEEYRAYCKLHFGVVILKEDPDFAEKYDQVMRPLPYDTKLALMAEPFDFPVSRLMQTEQMKRYLDAMYQHFTGLGFRLTDPNWQGWDVA